MYKRILLFFMCALVIISCANDKPFMSGYIKSAIDGLMTNCDPNNSGALHTCVIYSSPSQNSLLVYNASAEELVLAPIRYFPLKIQVGPYTNNLVSVASNNKKFPDFLALDPVEKAIFVVRLFPSAAGEKSFSTPRRIALTKDPKDPAPYRIAAYEGADRVVVLLSYPDTQSIGFLALNKQSGEQIGDMKFIDNQGKRPSHLAIDISPTGNKVIISDEQAKKLISYLIKDINNLMTEKAPGLGADKIDIGVQSDRIYVEQRDFGKGLKSYLAALSSLDDKLTLVDLETKQHATIKLGEHPTALYFPDKDSEPCCNNKKNWLAVVGVKGNLIHILVEYEGDNLKLKAEPSIDIKSEKNLSLTQLSVVKIVGGKVMVDKSLKREIECPNNRKMFFISSYALDKPFWGTEEELLGEYESFEVEAQGESCEGDGTATRLGDNNRSKENRRRELKTSSES